MSLHVHDLITSVAVACLLAGMLPAAWHRATLPLSTCIVTGGVCEILAANWASSGFWYSSSMEFANAACWSVLLAHSLRVASRRHFVCAALAAAPLLVCGAAMALSAATRLTSGVSAATHESIVAVAAIVLTLALVPTIYRRAVLPLSTCLIVGGSVTVLALNFATMAYWYPAAVEAINTGCWAFLLLTSLRSSASSAYLADNTPQAACGDTTRPVGSERLGVQPGRL